MLNLSVSPKVCVLTLSVSLQVCVFNLLFVVCVAVALPCRQWRPLLSGMCTVWTCVVTVCKMLYQLNVVQPTRYSSNCTMVTLSDLFVCLSQGRPIYLGTPKKRISRKPLLWLNHYKSQHVSDIRSSSGLQTTPGPSCTVSIANKKYSHDPYQPFV